MIKNIQKIHCIGIGGIGVSALARFWHAQGKEVSGSDAEESEVTQALEKQGIKVAVSDHGQSLANKGLSMVADLVVYSDAVPENHPERVAARAAGIPELSYAQALGEVSRSYRTIVVTGTHGKSTTTALLGLMLEAAGLDPLVIVGTKVPSWPRGNLRLSNATSYSLPTTYFVVEGDDYRDHFLELTPYAVVVTNIEYDHPDYFRDLDHTVESFAKLIVKVPSDGFIAVNADDRGCQQLIQHIPKSLSRATKRLVSFGRGSELFGVLTPQVPGEFNRYNATAAAVCAMELGVAREVVERVAREFRGVWRRFEIVGTLICHPERLPAQAGSEGSPANAGGRTFVRDSSPATPYQNDDVVVVSDYAHHPTAIRATMKAAREAYPGRRLVLVYQPHQHSRTKRLFDDFVSALCDAADVVIVSEIYAVKGRMEEQDVNSRDIVEAIKQLSDEAIRPNNLITQSLNDSILYGGDLVETKHMVLKHVKPRDVVIFMGAGDIDSLARELVLKSKVRQNLHTI